MATHIREVTGQVFQVERNRTPGRFWLGWRSSWVVARRLCTVTCHHATIRSHTEAPTTAHHTHKAGTGGWQATPGCDGCPRHLRQVASRVKNGDRSRTPFVQLQVREPNGSDVCFSFSASTGKRVRWRLWEPTAGPSMVLVPKPTLSPGIPPAWNLSPQGLR